MSHRTSRSLRSRTDAISRMIRALPRDASEWEPGDLAALDRIERDIQTVRGQAVAGLRDSGHTDAAIARAMGISRQAVSKRWPGGGRYVGAAGRYRTPQPQESTTP